MYPVQPAGAGTPRLVVEGASQELGALRGFLAATFRIPLADGSAGGTVALEVVSLALAEVRDGAGAVVLDSADLRIRRAGDTFTLQTDGGWLRTEPGRGRARLGLAPRFWAQGLATRREFFLLGLLILLHEQRWFGMHACSVSRRGRGVLLVGPSGSGKTTLTVACLAAGWACQSDDAVLLGERHGEVATMALRRGFSADGSLAARFPRLGLDWAGSPWLAGGKHLLDLDGMFGGQMESRCAPRVLCFPRIGTGRRSALRRVAPAQALLGVLRQSPGLLAGLPATEQQLATLGRLVDQTAAYQLELGADASAEPGVGAELLRSAFEEHAGEEPDGDGGH